MDTKQNGNLSVKRPFSKCNSRQLQLSNADDDDSKLLPVECDGDDDEGVNWAFFAYLPTTVFFFIIFCLFY